MTNGDIVLLRYVSVKKDFWGILWDSRIIPIYLQEKLWVSRPERPFREDRHCNVFEYYMTSVQLCYVN